MTTTGYSKWYLSLIFTINYSVFTLEVVFLCLFLCRYDAQCRKHLTVSLYSYIHPHRIYIYVKVDVQEILLQALGYLKALICVCLFTEWGFPTSHACLETRDKVKERKTGGWSHRKGSQKVKEQRKTPSTDKLKCKHSQRTERETDNEGCLHLLEYWAMCSIAFSCLFS